MSFRRSLDLSWDPGPHPPLLSVAQLGFLLSSASTGMALRQATQQQPPFAKCFWPELSFSRLGTSVVGQQSGFNVKMSLWVHRKTSLSGPTHPLPQAPFSLLA